MSRRALGSLSTTRRVHDREAGTQVRTQLDELITITEPWDAPSDGEDYFVSLESLQNLPDGTYTLEMMQPCNAQPRAAAFAVDHGMLIEIRRRETDAGTIALDLGWR